MSESQTHAQSWFMVVQALFNWLLGIKKALHTDTHLYTFSLDSCAASPSFIVHQPFPVCLLGTAEGWWHSPRTSMGTNRQRNGWESVVNQAVWCNIRCWKTTLSFDRAKWKTLHTVLRAECRAQFLPVLEYKNLHNLLGLFFKSLLKLSPYEY